MPTVTANEFPLAFVHVEEEPCAPPLPGQSNRDVGPVSTDLCRTTRALPWAVVKRPVGAQAVDSG